MEIPLLLIGVTGTGMCLSWVEVAGWCTNTQNATPKGTSSALLTELRTHQIALEIVIQFLRLALGGFWRAHDLI